MDDFLLQLKKLSKNNETEKMEALLSKKVEQEPNNIGLLLLLARVELIPPVADYYKSLDLLEKVLSLAPNHVIAILLTAYIHHFCLGGVDKDLLHKITAIKTDDNEEKSMLAYAASWFYQDQQIADSKSKELHEGEMRCLLESIQFCDKHVWNHEHLAQLYIKENRIIEAQFHLKKALNNVVKVYSDTFDNYDQTDMNEYINDRFKGIYQTKFYIKIFQDELDKLYKLTDA